MKTRIILTTLFLAGCQTAPQVTEPMYQEPQPTDIKWFSKGCEMYGAVSFENTDKNLVFQVPIDICGRGA